MNPRCDKGLWDCHFPTTNISLKNMQNLAGDSIKMGRLLSFTAVSFVGVNMCGIVLDNYVDFKRHDGVPFYLTSLESQCVKKLIFVSK